MDRTEIVDKLKRLIEEQDEIEIADADKKLDIDSYTMMLVITFVQDDMGIQLDMDKLDFDAFTSLNTFADLVLEAAKAPAG
jgi:acyl carrier protein